MDNEDYFLTVTYRDRSMAPLVSVSHLSFVHNLCFVRNARRREYVPPRFEHFVESKSPLNMFPKPILLSLSLTLTLLLSLCACSTPMDVAYFQDAANLNDMLVTKEQQFTLRPEDKINIIVNSSNPMLEQQFTLTASTNGRSLGATVIPKTTAGGSGGSSGMVIAYTVDDQGTINFPVLGKISVVGKTRKQVSEYIQDRLIARELVDDPIVTVEYVNMGINVLGEVSRPGHIDITRDHFTITDALAYAGDLTINANRTNVMVTRQVDGLNKVYYIDLTNMQNTLQSEAYYLQQNDLVYVSPNAKKQRESKAIGNTFNTPGIWMSLTSMAMTLVTFFTAISK